MIRIYCLVDPRDNLPFYVGATTYSLQKRLQAHLYENVIKFTMPERKEKIMSILNKGLKPKIYTLCYTNKHKADLIESSYYHFFISLGVQLLQNQYRFTYQGHYCKSVANIS